jgi:hypothetical protein
VWVNCELRHSIFCVIHEYLLTMTIVKEFLKLLDEFVEYSVFNGFYFIKIRKGKSSWDSVFLYEYSVILKTECQRS